MTENFEKTFKDLGGTIVAKESYATNDKDFNAQLTKIKNAAPDMLYLPDYYGTVALIAKQARAQGIMIPLVGADGWDGLTANAGDEVLNGYYSNHYAVDSNSPAVQQFVTSSSAENHISAIYTKILQSLEVQQASFCRKRKLKSLTSTKGAEPVIKTV